MGLQRFFALVHVDYRTCERCGNSQTLCSCAADQAAGDRPSANNCLVLLIAGPDTDVPL